MSGHRVGEVTLKISN